MKVLLGLSLLVLGATCCLAAAANNEEDFLTFPPTTTCAPCVCTTAPPCGCTTTTPPCATPPPIRVPCPECVNAYCTPDMCNQAVHVPYPGDCTKFCECDNDGAVAFDCPDGLWFNPVLQVCDWPVPSGCTEENTWLPGCR